MRALVTGSSGFVGRHMTAELRARNWDVVECDIADDHGQARLGALHLFRQRAAPRFDLVVHCAARAPHRAAIDGQPMNLAYNLQLDAAMLEWAVRTRQQRVLYLSSSAVYPVLLQDADPPRQLHESATELTHGIMPDAAYGWTKLTGEKMAAAAAIFSPVSLVHPYAASGMIPWVSSVADSCSCRGGSASWRSTG